MPGTLLSVSHVLMQYLLDTTEFPVECLAAQHPLRLDLLPIFPIANWGLCFHIDDVVFLTMMPPINYRPQGLGSLLLFSIHDSRDDGGCLN